MGMCVQKGGDVEGLVCCFFVCDMHKCTTAVGRVPPIMYRSGRVFRVAFPGLAGGERGKIILSQSLL